MFVRLDPLIEGGEPRTRVTILCQQVNPKMPGGVEAPEWVMIWRGAARMSHTQPPLQRPSEESRGQAPDASHA